MDPYKVLGIAKNASRKAIDSAYRRLAKQNHPDVNSAHDAEEIMKRINAAYEMAIGRRVVAPPVIYQQWKPIIFVTIHGGGSYGFSTGTDTTASGVNCGIWL